jgi:hypothetical protein
LMASAKPPLYSVSKSFSDVSAEASPASTPPKDMRRLRMPIGNHVQQEVCAANHERQYRA